ncbi:site-specific integrase [Nonomuraea recticatena]|uniref:Site-specific integrase n=2 Tax=Nonomuraea recticatena TaxID=46178 RepID=A0ABP6ECZ7_9ACTN
MPRQTSAGTPTRPRYHDPAKCGKRCKCPFVARYRPYPGAKPVEETFPTKTEAQKRLDEVWQLKQGGVFGDVSIPNMDLLAYLREVTSRRRRLSAASRSRYDGHLRNHLAAYIKGIKVKDFTSLKLTEITDAMYKTDVDKHMIGQIVSIIRYAYDRAMTDGLVSRNPATGAEVDHNVTHRPKYIPTDEDLAAIVAVAKERCRDAIIIAAGTGLRLSEILALDSSCVLDGTTLRITRQWNQSEGGLVRLKMKGEGFFRDVPMPPQVRDIIKRRLKESPSGFVFWSPKNADLPITKAVIGNELRVARAAIGDLEGKIVLHGFRHYAASKMLAAGVDIWEVAKILGHEDIRITYATYAHLLRPRFDQAFAALSANLPNAGNLRSVA